jgi:hypothetical protein
MIFPERCAVFQVGEEECCNTWVRTHGV